MREILTDAFLALLDPELAPLGEGAAALMLYTDSRVRAAIHEAQYRGNDRAFALLAAALAEYLRDEDLKGARLVPVPLGPARRAAGGYNQVEEVLKIAAKDLSLPIEAEVLIRTRETISQVSLPKWRRKQNMRGAFGAAHSPDPAYLYIVVDDVLTTGATLSAAISALKSAGATKILAIALAH